MRAHGLRFRLLPCLLLGLTACGETPDLFIAEINAPDSATPGDLLEAGLVSANVQNNGSGATTTSRDDGYIALDWALSLDETLPGGLLSFSATYQDDALLRGGRDSVPDGLSPATSSLVVNREGLLITPDTPFGVYNLCASVDSEDTVAESNEANNVTCRVISVVAPTEDFCIDFEQASRAEAVDRASSRNLYSDLGITFTSDPIIFRPGPIGDPHGGPLYDGYQGLFQGDPDAARPERSCAPLTFSLSFGLRAERVTFEARNVGFIAFPVHITAIAHGAAELEVVEVDRRSIVNQSQLGNLSTVENFTLESAPDEPPITDVLIDYGTCPPHVALDNLCVEVREAPE